MKVLVQQQFHLGHHYLYVAQLLPRLSELAEVVVAVTPEGLASSEFSLFLGPFAERVRFEPTLPPASPWLPMGERLRVHRDLRAAVRRLRPGYVLIPSGDAQATFMSPFRLVGLGNVPNRVPCEVGIHFGAGQTGASLRRRLRNDLNAAGLRLSGLTRVHLVNFLFYEDLVRSAPDQSRFTLMPHPVPRPASVEKEEARRRLGAPADGIYIGLAASIDSRKAVKEFLVAFRRVARQGERVLLAGVINRTHAETIRTDFGDLVTDGRLVVINRFLTHSEYQTALMALDVVCTPYPGFEGLSSTLLEAVAAGRPVLANDAGWTRSVVRRFALGWLCDVTNVDAFAGALRRALDGAATFRADAATQRLLEFHAPENFALHWTQGLGTLLGRSPATPRSWEWVMESVPQALREEK